MTATDPVAEALTRTHEVIERVHSVLLLMTAKVRTECEEESRPIQDFVETIKDADGWDEIRSYLRPYLRGDEDWPEVPNYRLKESWSDRQIRDEIVNLRDAVAQLRQAVDEHALTHALIALAGDRSGPR